MQKRRKALILGERAIALIIAEQMENEGFDPIFTSDLEPLKLPGFVNATSISAVRALLTKFAKFSFGRGIVHPGTTIWAERPELASIAEELSLSVVCASSRVMSQFGNKLNFLLEAEKCGISNLVLNSDPIHTKREIDNFVQKSNQNFPFVLRAVKGGGSLGVFVVHDSEMLERKLPIWFDQLRKTHGEVILFAERYIEGARQIVVPFARFQDGNTQVFPSIDASLQCRYRKVVQFCPATQTASDVLNQLSDWVVRLAEYWGFVGVGAFEFLVDSSKIALIDGLPRLTTSFPLWEKVAGTSAVSWQIATLENYSDKYAPTTRAAEDWINGISARIFAEDSLFHLPQPGDIFEVVESRKWNISDGNSSAEAEIHANYTAGGKALVDDSGLLAWVQVNSPNRSGLLALLMKALEDFWIAGTLQTNERFLSELLSHPWVTEEIFHAAFIDEEFLPVLRPPVEMVPIFAAVLRKCDEKSDQKSDQKSEMSLWLVGDQYLKNTQIPQIQWLSVGNPTTGTGISGLVQTESGVQLRAAAYTLPPLSGNKISNRWLVRLGFWFMSVRQVLSDASVPKKSVLSSLVTGRVHAVLFRNGNLVQAHDPLLVIESLGNFIPHALPLRAKVLSWKVSAEEAVYVGQELAEIEVYKNERKD